MTPAAFQSERTQEANAFQIPYYKMLKTYFILTGQHPSQSNFVNKFITTLIVGILVSYILPTYFQIHVSSREKDWNGVIECMPHLVTSIVSIIKLMSLQLNRKDLQKLYVSVKKDWEILELSGDLHVLKDMTKTGSTIALLYRCNLLFFLTLFVLIPMLNPALDIIMPLNETRPRQTVFKAYYFVGDDEYFYFKYWHATISAAVCVVPIVGVDSFYMTIAHHAAGLFAACGCKIRKLTENMGKREIASEDIGFEEVRQCIVAHNKALEFAAFLDNMNRQNFLLQVGMNMIGISVTAFQVATHLSELDQVMRFGMFCVGQNFHLFYISVPGQIIADQSIYLARTLYDSEWYNAPVKIQKILLIIQMRASEPYELTAGGLYKMNVETFGMTFKTCMSYFTMMLSMQE
ncbi:odorant receptor 4-like [Hylaeus anthracinus]|uniref:odorant receptor 4-like n=1 Tax=Hylaeus anthracinus TaxID=313031 RepID=UPI0023B918A8|nr:odorant receptor 4-like [Hylaeus anthracinus]